MLISNYNEVRESLVNILIDLDATNTTYQTDIYLYIDDNNKGTLDTFVNIGGNSWLNDDHINIYQYKPNGNNWIADAFDIDMEQVNNFTYNELRDMLIDAFYSEYVENANLILDNVEKEF